MKAISDETTDSPLSDWDESVCPAQDPDRTESVLTLEVLSEHAGMRLDKFLSEQARGFTRSYLQKLIKDHILRKVGKNIVLVPFSSRETDFDGMIVLNQTGEFICRKLEQDISREELIRNLAEEYDENIETVEKDTDVFLAQLAECHMLIP